MTSNVKPESTDLAIASLILGILSLAGAGPLTGIPAIITGWLALRRNTFNKGMAIAGIITGAMSLLFAILIVVAFVLLLVLVVFAAGAQDIGPEYFDEAPDSSQRQQRA